MSDTMDARTAARYGLSKEVLQLVIVILFGSLLGALGTAQIGAVHGGLAAILSNLIGAFTAAVGALLQLGGMIGLLYKVLSDATQ